MGDKWRRFNTLIVNLLNPSEAMLPRRILAAIWLLATLSQADYAETVHSLFTSLKREFGTVKAPVNGTIPSWVNVDRYANGFGKVCGPIVASHAV